MSRACLRLHLVDSIKNDLPLFIPTAAFLFQFTDTHLVDSVVDRREIGIGMALSGGVTLPNAWTERGRSSTELPTKVVQTRPESLSLDVVTLTW